MKSFYNIMTRYITRSKHIETKSITQLLDFFEICPVDNMHTGTYACAMNYISQGLGHWERIKHTGQNYINIINLLYNFRDFISYNSYLYIICMNYPITNFKNNKAPVIKSKHIKINKQYDNTYTTKIPLAVLLSNDKCLLPIDISFIYSNKYYNVIKPKYNKLFKPALLKSSHIIHYDIETYNVGNLVFACDYLFDYTRNKIQVSSNTFKDVCVPMNKLDFISVNRPSLEHYIISAYKYNNYKLPKYIEYIKTNINSIVTENSPPELVKMFNELTLHKEFVPKYISTQIKKKRIRKRKIIIKTKRYRRINE